MCSSGPVYRIRPSLQIRTGGSLGASRNSRVTEDERINLHFAVSASSLIGVIVVPFNLKTRHHSMVDVPAPGALETV